MIWLLVKAVIRFGVFGAVFGVASHRSRSIAIKPRVGLLAVTLVFALLNTGIYSIAEPVLNVATLGALWFLVPFIVNGCFLYVTGRITGVLSIEVDLGGAFTTLWLAAVLTAAHGVLYLTLDAPSLIPLAAGQGH